MLFREEHFEKNYGEKYLQMPKNHEKLPSMQRVYKSLKTVSKLFLLYQSLLCWDPSNE